MSGRFFYWIVGVSPLKSGFYGKKTSIGLIVESVHNLSVSKHAAFVFVTTSASQHSLLLYKCIKNNVILNVCNAC